MGQVVTMSFKGNKILHKLFKCPTFWRIRPAFHCPQCNKGYRCYWDGNDVAGHGIDYCDKCARALESEKVAQ